VGSTVRGYRSRVDGSIQPYAIIVPAAGAGRGEDDRFRLDVVLHGRDARLQEARFFDAHDGKPAPADLPGLVLHVYGRGNNAYRWAGETDVHEAIEAVKRNYRVDHRRVVLRGFSMGGAGAWHLGLHDPSRWSSVEAGAGFTETIRYAHLENPSEVVRKGLHIYDAVDYARNAFGVPIAGYGGENDPQRQASMNIEDALVALGVTMKTDGLVTRAEGLDFVRIVGKGMGHAVDKESAGFLKAFHDRHAVKGSDLDASKIRFVTYTLKYPRVAWLSIARLREHYQPATLDAEITGDVATIKAENVAVLAVARQVAETVRLGTQEFPLRTAAEGLLPDVYFAKTDDGWALLDHPASIAIEENSRREKRPGLQGPIDDAFTGPFLCVRGTGTPWNPRVRAWALARLDRFTADWAKHFRGDLKIKNDVDVTDQDLQESHLILFGDPGSNRLIARMLPDLPVGWTREELRLAGSFPSVDHAPVFVTASPLNPLRYAVINGGHTFGAREFEGTNALLYPHLGDYAVFAIGEREEVRAGGYFNERWRLP
jgi:dienelactone hydrolase